jgi:Ca2+:H+ antiporter
MKPSLDWLLVLVPVAIVLEIASGPDLAIFLTAALAILPLAGLIGRSTEQLALHTGPRVGGLINATFGNVTELIIAIFLLMDDKVEIVKASLTGSILGNLLLVMGLSLFLGGGQAFGAVLQRARSLGACHFVGVGRDRPADAGVVRPGGPRIVPGA